MFNVINLSLLFIIVFTTGCTHKLQITPDNNQITNIGYEIEKKDYNIGYYIENKNLTIVNSAGVGDKLYYLPYDDTEGAFRYVLVKHFKKVYTIDDINEKEFISKNDIKLIFSYKMNTNSVSDSTMFTWQPSKFTITLDCKAVNNEGTMIWQKRVIGEGISKFNGKYDFSLAAKKASEDVFGKLLFVLNEKELKEVNK